MNVVTIQIPKHQPPSNACFLPAYTKRPIGIVNVLYSWTKALPLVATLGLLACTTALATERDQAKRIHDRIAGVPPTASVLDAMQADIEVGNTSDAAYRAMEHSAFYDVTLKNLAAPWTNEEM